MCEHFNRHALYTHKYKVQIDVAIAAADIHRSMNRRETIMNWCWMEHLMRAKTIKSLSLAPLYVLVALAKNA